ncbi:hypothetical protein [Deinococcus humi]|uniref:Uncharacterized protein n=1 Tax=Deinococcus humi TaxID=662880 RepID=A0A7W8JSY5_9DEIO|nr:hypothetical protein [Deinococcus humi]MBB5361226.1 hypothetical protein [Deinococcus humi]GGO19037.1 hypothetical protein GCM10008949_02940 [Deinococcus humi]
MPEHHKTRASRQKAEHFFLKYARLPLGERSLARLRAELQKEKISVSLRTLERYSELYKWTEQLRQLSVKDQAKDQAAATRWVEKIRSRRREYYYNRELHPQEWAAEQLIAAVDKICPHCTYNLLGEQDQLRLCQQCTDQIRPLIRALQQGVPAAAVLKQQFEQELLAERREGFRLEDYLEPSEPS